MASHIRSKPDRERRSLDEKTGRQTPTAPNPRQRRKVVKSRQKALCKWCGIHWRIIQKAVFGTLKMSV